MDTKDLLEGYVKERTKNLGPFPDIVQKGIDTIDGEVPFKLKLAITLAELITFGSHLRKPIKLYDGTLVPTNAIVFALSASGTSKDKALSALRKSLNTGYEQLEGQRRDFAREKAEKAALLDGKDVGDWQSYYLAPKPLQAGLGTVEGLVQHFADTSQDPIGAGAVLSSEIGSELQSNPIMVDIIKIISVAYDLGNIPPKIVKSQENQTDTVKSLPVNALFFGSQEALLFDNAIKSKFKLVFNTQLARRSIFTYTPEQPPRLSITNIDDLHKRKEKERERVMRAQKALGDLTANLVGNTNQEPLLIEPAAQKLFDVYLEYNTMESDDQSNKFPISKLSRKHKQWLALKLAGTYAILEGYEFISEALYAQAINTVELLSPNLSEFEKELVKEPYELLADMCQFNAEDGQFFMSLHELRKMGYVTGSASKSKVEELATLSNSYDENGAYACQDHGIQYQEIVKTDVVGVSFKMFDSTRSGDSLKKYMVRNADAGYKFLETDFADLGRLLLENAAYSPFQFDGGKRTRETLMGGTKFVVLDIDKSMLTDEEAHVLLNEYNHYIARTSNPDNEFKFRVLLELDSVVEVDGQTWKALLEEIGDELGLVLDLVPQSQLFLSFAGRDILSQLDGQTLRTKFLLERAALRVRDKPKPVTALPTKEKSLKLKDPRETFSIGFEAEKGERSNKIYRMLAYAVDLGADEEYIRNLANEINQYYMTPMDQDRLDRTLIEPILRRIV